jgi:saccharopine dehydrogenase (NAD+, L-lysine-forming)
MTQSNILLYGATGFSGGLIAAEGKARGMSKKESTSGCRMTLAARDAGRLRAVAEKNDMDFRVFGLDHVEDIRRSIDGFDVVINAAGPFAFTAPPLAEAALEARCHYVDINGEIDVYRNLDDLALKASQRGIAMVSGAGSSAGASDVLLDHALARLVDARELEAKAELGSVRIAVSQSMDLSRGSALTAARLLREQVVVVRKGQIRDFAGDPRQQPVVSHEPVGKIERMFDFGLSSEPNEKLKKGDQSRSRGARLRIASAANLIDTLTAKNTIARRKLRASSIESYVEMGTLNRIAYQFAGMLSPFASLPLARAAIEVPLSLLPEGPTQQELTQQRHLVVLEIEDPYSRRLVDWRWETPDVYQFTAQLAVAAAFGVAAIRPNDKDNTGWVTPAHALRLGGDDNFSEAVRGCDDLDKFGLPQ